MPEVERRYRVRKDGRGRALAGLSVGGYQALQLLTTVPGEFAHVAVWSAPVESGTVDRFEKEQAAFLNDAPRRNRLLKSLWVRIGMEDAGLPHVQRLSGVLTIHGIKNDLRVTEGGHRWDNWRRYLHELAPRLFR